MHAARPGSRDRPAAAGLRGAQVQSGFVSWSRTLGRRCPVGRPANWFLHSTGEVATELRGEGSPGMLARGLFWMPASFCLLS